MNVVLARYLRYAIDCENMARTALNVPPKECYWQYIKQKRR